MKPFQQRRPFFQAATSEVRSRRRQANVTLHERRFHLSRWIAALALTALLISCASLTPERISVLVQIATQAAQLGAQEWLAKHPEQRAAFQAVIDAINIELRAGNVTKAIAMLHSLPVTSLGGKDGEVYWTGPPRATNAVAEVATVGTLVVWDGELKKAVRVTGAAEKPVVTAVRDGLRRAVAPKPPALPARSRKPVAESVLSVVTKTTGSPLTITNDAVYPVKLVGRTNVTRSVLDVQTHAGSVPVVTVRWTQVPGNIYHIQQRESETNAVWHCFATITNLSGTGETRWSVPWPPSVSAGTWRVLRVR